MKIMGKKILGLALAIVMCAVILAPTVFAQDLDIKTELENVGGGIGYSEGQSDDLSGIIGRIIKAVLGFLGVVMVIIVIYAGFLYMTAGGNEEQTKKAKAWIVNSIIGLVLILLAYAITGFVIDKLIDATT